MTPSADDQDFPSSDQRRIIAEEEFRKATAKRLEQEMEASKDRWGRRLNSPVGIWFLSSVIVGIASALYQQWTARREDEAQQRPIIVSTTNELLSRLGACNRIRLTSDRNDVENLLSSVIGLRPLNKEFKDRNLADVYYQFCALHGKCEFDPDSLVDVAEDIRRTTWPVIVGQPINQPLKDRSVLPKLEASCARLIPVRRAVRASLRS